MKFLRVGEKGKEIIAALDGEKKIKDLSSHIKDLNPDTINFENLDRLKKINLNTLPEINQSVRIGSCINKPGDFLAIGLNYKAHADGTNSKLPTEPILFNKSTGCIQGPNDSIIKPANAKKLDYEVGGQWIKGKSIAGPCGPTLVTKDEIEDINNINLTLDINGERRQSGNTSSMIFNFNFLVSHISQFMTLYPGTIITTGTPSGTAMEMKEPKFLQAGDEIKIKIDYLGEQLQVVVDE